MRAGEDHATGSPWTGALNSAWHCKGAGFVPVCPQGALTRTHEVRHRGERGRRVLHRQPRPPDAVVGVQCARRRCRGRNHARLADALRPVGPFGLWLLDEDDLDIGHPARGDDVQGLQRLRDGEPAFDDELLGERLPEAHVNAALDLALDQGRVDRPPHVVGGDHLREPALVVEQDDLCRPPVAEVRDGLVGVVRRRPVDDVLALDLPARERLERTPGELLPELACGVEHGVAAEHRRAGGGRLAGVELALRVDDDPHALRLEPELLAGDLAERGVHALPHLRPGVEERERPVRLRPEHCAAELDDAVPDPRVLQAAGDAGEARLPVGVAHGEQRLLQADARAEPLPGAGAVSLAEHVPEADLPAVDPDLLREQVEDPLDREVRLADTEAAHRAAGRVVGIDGPRLDVDVRHAVGAAGVSGRPLEHLVADARVRPGVPDDAGPEREQVPLLVAAGGVLHPQRVPLRVEADALPAAEGDQDGASGDRRHERRVALDVQVLLRAEGAAGRHLRDAHLLPRKREEGGDLVPVLPGALALRVHVQRPVAVGHGERGLGLEERVLDELRAVRLGDDVRSARERGVHVAPLHARDRENVAARMQERCVLLERVEGVGDRVEHLVLDLHERRRLAGGMTALGRDGGEHVTDVRRHLALGDELSPVLRQGALRALALHVGGGHHRDDPGVSRRLRRVDPDDARARVVREAERSVQHPGLDEVADVQLVAEREAGALVACRAGADAPAALGLGEGDASVGRSHEPHRVDDLRVARAAAEVPEQRVRDVLARGLRVLAEKRLGLHDDPGGAVAALGRAGGHERVGPEPALVLGQPLLRDDVFPLDPRRLLRAGDDGAPVHEDGAGPAGALRRAAVLHGAHAEVVAEQLEQALPFVRLRDDLPSVERELHLYSTAPSTSASRPIRMTTPLNASCQ